MLNISPVIKGLKSLDYRSFFVVRNVLCMTDQTLAEDRGFDVDATITEIFAKTQRVCCKEY